MFHFFQLIMELENCNSHGDHVSTTLQHENDPSGNKKWYRQASQRLVKLIKLIFYQLYI